MMPCRILYFMMPCRFCPAESLSCRILSCRFFVLQVSCSARFLSCRFLVQQVSCPAGFLSCRILVLQVSCPAGPLSCRTYTGHDPAGFCPVEHISARIRRPISCKDCSVGFFMKDNLHGFVLQDMILQDFVV